MFFFLTSVKVSTIQFPMGLYGACITVWSAVTWWNTSSLSCGPSRLALTPSVWAKWLSSVGSCFNELDTLNHQQDRTGGFHQSAGRGLGVSCGLWEVRPSALRKRAAYQELLYSPCLINWQQTSMLNIKIQELRLWRYPKLISFASILHILSY